MHVSFEGAAVQVRREMEEFLGSVVSRDTLMETTAPVETLTTDVDTAAKPEPDEKPKRKRRTKAEMAAAKEVEADASEAGSGGVEANNESPEDGATDTPPARTRRRRRNSNDARGGDSDTASDGGDETPDTSDAGGSSEGKASSRRRRGKAKPAEEAPESDSTALEISDADVAKAASNAAAAITPKGVKDVLSQFGVISVDKLDQTQRREFIDILNEALED